MQTLIKRRANQRLPQDSGEWQAVKPRFRWLPSRTPKERGAARARHLVAFAIAAVCHVAVSRVALQSIEGMVLIAPVAAVPGTALGLLWLAQFKPLRLKQSTNAALSWILILTPLSAAYGLWGLFICAAYVAVWAVPTVLITAIVMHAIFGDRE